MHLTHHVPVGLVDEQVAECTSDLVLISRAPFAVGLVKCRSSAHSILIPPGLFLAPLYYLGSTSLIFSSTLCFYHKQHFLSRCVLSFTAGAGVRLSPAPRLFPRPFLFTLLWLKLWPTHQVWDLFSLFCTQGKPTYSGSYSSLILSVYNHDQDQAHKYLSMQAPPDSQLCWACWCWLSYGWWVDTWQVSFPWTT